MSESIEMRLVLRDEANPALEAMRAKVDAIAGSTSKAAQGVGALEKGLTTLGTSAAAASRGLGTVDNSLAAIPSVAQRAWAALNTVDGKVLSLGEQAKALQQKLGPAAAAISGVSSALGENAGQAGKAIASVGQLVAAYGSGGPLALAVTGMTLLVGQLQKSWDDEIAAQDRAIASANAGTDAAAALRRRVDADIANLRRTVNGPDTPETARANVQTEIDDVQRRRDAILAQRNALKVGTDGYDDARERFESERKILEGVLERLQLKQGLAGAAAAVATKPAPAPPGMKAPVADGDTLEDWKQRAYDRAAAEQKAQEKLAADRYELAISAAEKRTEAENAIELRAAKDKAAVLLELSEKTDEAILRHKRESAAADKAIIADVMGLAQSSTSALVSTTQGYIQAKIAGGEEAKNAEKIAGAEALKAIGDQLVGFGIMQTFKAAAYAIESGGFDPRAAGLAATGGAAIAVGVGLGAASAGITASIPSGGVGSSAEAARSTGASSSSRSSSSSGAPSSTVINITYGGPTGRVAEDVAKDVEKSQRKNAKRGRA